ncbi:MAG: hypothetical protein AB1483_02500 [Candidatus Zixiibacteriota bacterium]
MASRIIESKASQWGLLVSFVAVFALLSGLYLTGCSQSPTTSTDLTLSQDQEGFFELPYDETALEKEAVNPNMEVEVLYGEGLVTTEDGGDIWVGTAGNIHEFLVSPMAIPSDTIIQIGVTKVEWHDEIVVLYDFGPDGLQFAIPAVLKVNAQKLFGANVSAINWFYLDERTNTWQYQGSYQVDALGEIEIPVYHFSKYGASR